LFLLEIDLDTTNLDEGSNPWARGRIGAAINRGHFPHGKDHFGNDLEYLRGEPDFEGSDCLLIEWGE
jgi:hypothetical protein